MKHLITLTLILQCFLSLAQTTEFQGNISLINSSKVYKVVTVPNCPETYSPPAGTQSTITYETKYTNAKTEIKIESVASGTSSITVNANRIIKIPIFPNARGKANFYVDEKDKSLLYVNYWLNDVTVVPKDSTIAKFTAVFNCDGTVTMVPDGPKVKLQDSTEYYLWKVSPTSADVNTTWFRSSDHIQVYNADNTTINYYLVNRYDRNGKYILDLPNRAAIKYNSHSLDLGALTIPFKYRFGFKKNDIKVKDDVIASVNIGLYAGYKLSRYRIRNRAGTYVNENLSSLRVGPFFNLSAATLDSVATTVGEEPMKKDDKQTIAVLSPGLGLMYDIKGVQIGIYGGWDIGMGSDAKNWNYNKKFWLGFGIGYKLTDLFAKKD